MSRQLTLARNAKRIGTRTASVAGLPVIAEDLAPKVVGSIGSDGHPENHSDRTWITRQLGDVADIWNGATPNTQVPAYWNGTIPFVTPTDVTETIGKYLDVTARSVTTEGLASCPARLLPVGTILVCSRATIGEIKIAATSLCTNQGFKALVCRGPAFNEFVYYLLLTLKPKMVERATGSTFLEIDRRQMASIEARFPPLAEQHAIARALSDVDGLIEAFDALIAKKRAIKRGNMQQLLTGTTRLPGFEGEWITQRLGDVFAVRVGTSKSRYIANAGRYVIVDMGSVGADGQLKSTKRTDYNGDFLTTGDLVMPKDDIGGGKIIGKVAYIDTDYAYVLGDHVYALHLAIDGCPKFFSYLINGHQTNTALRSKVGGSAQLGLSRKAVEEQEIPIPSVAEQHAIADVLSDMDAEIAALEQRLDKTRAVKQGMMQQLLTGRVRLVEPEVAATVP